MAGLGVCLVAGTELLSVLHAITRPALLVFWLLTGGGRAACFGWAGRVLQLRKRRPGPGRGLCMAGQFVSRRGTNQADLAIFRWIRFCAARAGAEDVTDRHFQSCRMKPPY